jgi:predicted PurR-regulated permease PerM
VCIAVVITTFIIIRLIRIEETLVVIDKINSVIRPFIIGICLAYLLNFLYKKVLALEDKHLKFIKSDGLRKFLAIAFTYIITIGSFVLLIIVTIPSLSSSIKGVIDNLPKTIDNLRGIVDRFLKENKWIQAVLGSDVEEFQGRAQDLIVNNLNYDKDFFSNKLFEIISGTFTYAVNILVAIIVSIMLLANKEVMTEQCKKVILAIFGEKRSNIIFDELKIANKKFSGFLIGKLIDSIIIGIIAFVACVVMGINYSALIALIVGVTNIIPILGPFIGGGVSLIIVFSQSPGLTLHFVIFVVILQQIDGNIIGPKCIGNSLNLNSFWVLLSIFIFGNLFGFVGMIIGVPLFAVIYDIAGKVINNKIKKQTNKKEISVNDKIWVTDDKVECTYAICKFDNTDIES